MVPDQASGTTGLAPRDSSLLWVWWGAWYLEDEICDLLGTLL